MVGGLKQGSPRRMDNPGGPGDVRVRSDLLGPSPTNQVRSPAHPAGWTQSCNPNRDRRGGPSSKCCPLCPEIHYT
jgi:hypothetical protein